MILEKSRKNNARLGITGMLIYIEGTILQILEGEREIIEQMFLVIKDDARHTSVVRILEGAIEKRNFSDWSMGLRLISKEDFDKNLNYFNVQNITDLKNISEENNSLHLFIKAFCYGDI